MYDLELDRVVSEIKSRDAKRILLQLSDGMRPFALQLVKTIEKATDANVFLSGDSCYGACDVAFKQGEQLGVDLIIHYGHNQMAENSIIPVIYVHAKIDIDVDRLVEVVVPHLQYYQAVGLATTVQHIHQIEEIKEKLTEKNVILNIGKVPNKAVLDAQILGCSYITSIKIKENVDVFLYVGGGKFHPSGIVMSTGKPVIIANPYSGEVSSINEKDLMNLAKRRMAAITIAKNSKRFGVIVSSKPGQNNLNIALDLKRKLEAQDKEVVIIYMDEFKEEHINNFSEPEVLINTACPRISINGITGINRPILTINETEVVLGNRKWEELWGNGYME